MIYLTKDGDNIDRICHEFYGQTADMVEAVLDANQGLAKHGPLLTAGLRIKLPELKTAKDTPLRLWD